MKTRLYVLVVGASLLLGAVPVWAHHAFAAEFDVSQPVKVKGTVTKVEWVNPHAWIYVDVKDSDGKGRLPLDVLGSCVSGKRIRTESGINGDTGRAPLRVSGQAAWIRNLLSLSQNALISVTARAVNVCRTGRPENEIKEHKGPQGTCKGSAGITKDTQGTTSTFSLHRTLFSAKPAMPCLPTSSLGLSTKS